MQDTYTSSDDTWPHYICATCGGEAGDSDNLGVIVNGGYGSSRYDTSSLVWIVSGDEVYPRGYICDDCIDRAVSAGHLEEFHSSVRGEEVGLYLSEAAYRELFAYGSRKAYDAFWAQRDHSPYQKAIAPSKLEQAIVDMRYQLSGDVVLSSSYSMPRTRLGWTAVNIGYAHAVAAIAFGCGEADPDFEEASATWARARQTLDCQIDESWLETKALLGMDEIDS